jgi:hypothetical protein
MLNEWEQGRGHWVARREEDWVRKKRCPERSPSSGSARQALQEAGVDKAAVACSGPRHLKHARCLSPSAREVGQEEPALKESLLNGPEKGRWSVTSPTPLPQGPTSFEVIAVDQYKAQRKGRMSGGMRSFIYTVPWEMWAVPMLNGA